MLKASYSSSDETIASVDTNGLVTTKSEGTTYVTTNCKGKLGIFQMQVVPAGSFEPKVSYTKLTNALNKLLKKMPAKVTTQNVSKLFKSVKAYQAACKKISSEISESGFIGKKKYQLAVPQAGRYNACLQMLNVYAQKNSPLATRSAKVLKVDSVKASGGKIEITLKKAPTAKQLLSMKILSMDVLAEMKPYPKANRSAPKNKFYFYVNIRTATEESVIGLAYMTKGSKTVVVTPEQYLPKGTYYLGGSGVWTRGKQFLV